MSGVLERAAEFFLAPAASEPPVARAVVPPAIRAVALGAPADAVPLAAALALSLRAASRARTAVVAVWPSEPMAPDAETAANRDPEGDDRPVRESGMHDRPVRECGAHDRPVRDVRRLPASRSAATLAARRADRGLPAGARGRLVWLPLPSAASVAASLVRRASSVVEAPLVTALTGPRPAELDDLIAEHDHAIIAADPETALARAALAALTALGVAATAHLPPRRGLPRALAVAGLVARRIDVTQAGVARFEGAS